MRVFLLLSWLPVLAFAQPRELGAFVDEYAHAHDFSGVVLVRDDRHAPLQRAFGEARVDLFPSR